MNKTEYNKRKTVFFSVMGGLIAITGIGSIVTIPIPFMPIVILIMGIIIGVVLWFVWLSKYMKGVNIFKSYEKMYPSVETFRRRNFGRYGTCNC
jgi:hypothetical protein